MFNPDMLDARQVRHGAREDAYSDAARASASGMTSAVEERRIPLFGARRRRGVVGAGMQLVRARELVEGGHLHPPTLPSAVLFVTISPRSIYIVHKTSRICFP